MADADDFLRRFAVEIAAALREREDRETERRRGSTPSSSGSSSAPRAGTDGSVDDLYRALVFDEPLVDHVPNLPLAAASLARKLVAPSSPYALSNRLVNGIVYLCQRKAPKPGQAGGIDIDATTKNGNGNGNGNDHDLTAAAERNRPSHSAIQVAMARLAFCAAVEIPLECCKGSSLSEERMGRIRACLGSYQAAPGDAACSAPRFAGEVAPRSSNQDDQQTLLRHAAGSEEAKENDGGDEPGDGPNATPQQQQQQQQDPYGDEVWAAESDPSDYDYGEGDSYDAFPDRAPQDHSDTDWLDPKRLSLPDPDRTPAQAREAIGSLLRLGTYALLEPVFGLPKGETARHVSLLKQLVLVLLRPRKPLGSEKTEANGEDLLDASMDSAVLSPLWILRDAAACHRKGQTTGSSRTDCEQAYLEVLQTLLGTDRAYLEDVGAHHQRSKDAIDLCLPSIVGLSSLSAWCAAAVPATRATIEAVVDASNDLEHVVQRGLAHYRANLPDTLAPILESLSGIGYEGASGRRNLSASACYAGSSVPQALLNSGLLRQVLVLAEPPCGGALPGSLLGLHHALWGLCVAYPKIVGKYVFRCPGSERIVRSYAPGRGPSGSVSPPHCVECVLWNLYGWHQSGEPGAASGRLVLRKPGAPPPKPLARDECGEVCRKAWSELCRWVVRALEGGDDDGSDADAGRVVGEWGRLLALVASLPSISAAFRSLVGDDVSDRLDEIAAAVSRRSEPTRTPGESSGEDSRDDGERDDSRSRSSKDKDDDDKPSRKQKIASRAHKLLKEYKLFFQGGTVGSSKTD